MLEVPAAHRAVGRATGLDFGENLIPPEDRAARPGEELVEQKRSLTGRSADDTGAPSDRAGGMSADGDARQMFPATVARLRIWIEARVDAA